MQNQYTYFYVICGPGLFPFATLEKINDRQRIEIPYERSFVPELENRKLVNRYKILSLYLSIQSSRICLLCKGLLFLEMLTLVR